jgi:glycosyltransferase involved in cell wall biosynthesis
MASKVLRVGLISSYIPKKCGIATFSRDLIGAIEKETNIEWRLIAAEDATESHDYKGKELAVLKKNKKQSYIDAADKLNKWKPDVVLLEHEFGLFGGKWASFSYNGIKRHDPTGDFVIELLNDISAPVVTTLHTVLPEPSSAHREVVRSIAERSDKLIVMSDDSREIIHHDYGIAYDKVVSIPHGVPDPTKGDRNEIIDDLGFDRDKFYLVVTGLIGPNKGIATIVKALPNVVNAHKEVVLLVVGQTHPDILAQDGEAYRNSLIKLASDLGVSDHVQFVNDYLPTEKLVEYMTIANIYLTMHSDPEQSTSGTLAYALGCGLVAISTPYRYAKEVLGHGRGFIVPFDDPNKLAAMINKLVEDKDLYVKTKKLAAEYGKTMRWPIVANSYIKILEAAAED